MRISDWSSDVCSSDLPGVAVDAKPSSHVGRAGRLARRGVRDRPFHPRRVRVAIEQAGVVRHRALLLGRGELLDQHLIEHRPRVRSEEHTSELQSLMSITYDGY